MTAETISATELTEGPIYELFRAIMREIDNSDIDVGDAIVVLGNIAAYAFKDLSIENVGSALEALAETTFQRLLLERTSQPCEGKPN